MKIKFCLLYSFIFVSFFAAAKENIFLKHFKIKLSSSNDFKIESVKDEDSGSSSSNLTITPCYGAALDFPVSQLRFYSNKEQFAFGLCIRTDNFTKKLPCSYKFGRLTASGGISQMNNPLLSSSSSPFSSASFTPCLTSASLPAKSSFSKPYSSFLQLAFHNKGAVLEDLKTNLFYNPDENQLVYSSLLQISTTWPVIFSFSSAAGYFEYDENTFSSWFTDSDFYYHKGKHFCGASSFLISAANFNSCIKTFVYESPFGNTDWIFRTDNSLKAKKNTFYLSALYNQNSSVLTSSQKNIKNCFQLKSGLQNQFRADYKKPVFIKTGLNFYGNFNLSDTEHQFKISSGLQFSSSLCSFCITGNLAAKLYTQIPSDYNFINNSIGAVQTTFESTGLQIKNLWHFKTFSPQLSASAVFTPSSDFTSFTLTQKYGLKMIFTRTADFSYSASLSCKNFQIQNCKQSCCTQINLTRKHVNYTLKLSADFLQDS